MSKQQEQAAQRTITVHDFAGFDPRYVYDRTQTDVSIMDGDVLNLGDGNVAIVVKAWPVVVLGDIEDFQRLAYGSSFETIDGGKYAASAAKARELFAPAAITSLDEPPKVRDLFAPFALAAAEEGLTLAAPVPSELSCAQPSQEQSHVLQQLNELLDSAVEDALNAGCLRVQTALKIQFGDAAGVFFTGHHRQVVHNAFRDYLLIEVNEIDAQVVSLMAQTSPQG